MGVRTDGIRGEFHCHNRYSNYMEPATRFPMDSPMTPLEQMDASFERGLDFIFITNHNTTNGFKQLSECRESHPKLKMVSVYQGEEVTALLPDGHHGHVLGWGLSEEVKRWLSVEETTDEIRSQGAVSCAAHPYGLTFATREKAMLCDLIEVFNSGNIDKYSNFRAHESAVKWKKFGMAGSDAHMPDGVGRCVVRVYSDNSMEGILKAVRHGRFVIEKAEYDTVGYLKRHLQFSLSDISRLTSSLRRDYGWAMESVTRYLVSRFRKNPDEFWVDPFMDLMLHRIRNMSMKVNMYGYDERWFREKLLRQLVESFLPPRKKNMGPVIDMNKFKSVDLHIMMNALNESVRPGTAYV